MIELTKQQLIAKVTTLPQDLQDAIAAPETLETLEVIGKKYELDVVHIGLLHRLTVKLLAGVILPQEFVASIENDLGIEHEKAMLVAQEINRDIFNRVKDALKEVHSMKPQPVAAVIQAAPTTAAPKPTPPPPAAAPKPVSKFSVASALGNIPATMPTVAVTTVIPATAKPPIGVVAAVAPIVQKSAPTTPQQTATLGEPKPHIGNIFEEKLGGTYTLPTQPVAQAPTQVIPPPPQATTPSAPKVDPYREAA